MKLSRNWLVEYVDLGDLAPERLSDLLTMLGLEVDGVEQVGATFDGVVVGHVVEAREHPNADRLKLCDVDIGEGEPVQIVCGGPNVATGQRVPVAVVGTTLMLPSRKSPGDLEPVTLSKVKIRGEVSNGMICSESELGLGDDHSGIMVLDDEAPIGEPFARFLASRGRSTSDHVFDVAITPNRPDATSHVGAARDLAAVLGTTLSIPPINERPAGNSDALEIKIDAPEACPRYVGLVVRGVRIGPSPEWLQERLRAIGLRPINNVVDVTNFVMHEIGQPLHAFDLAKVKGDEGKEASINVRLTTGEERFVTLDDQERTLPPKTLLICDAGRALAVAGVMGGANSEVTDETTDILIESAYFEPGGIRKTARALGLQTDSSYRFERGADPAIQAWAANRAADLIAEIAGGRPEPYLVDAHPNPSSPRTFDLRPDRATQVLGVEIEREMMASLLERIGFGVHDIGEGLRVEVPTFRPDIGHEVDVIEEVARLHGYDRIPLPGRMTLPSVAPRPNVFLEARKEAVDRLVGLGFRELYCNSLLPEAVAERYARPPFVPAGTSAVVTANAINQEMAALRPSLLPGVLNAIAYNLNRNAESLRVFELGHVFGRDEQADDVLVEGYREHESLIIAMAGEAVSPRWDRETRPVDFYDLKGVVHHLLDALGAPEASEHVDPSPNEITTYALSLRIGEETIATLGRVADETTGFHDVDSEVFFAEIDWSRLAAILVEQPDRRYSPISRHPESERDIALVVDEAVPVGELLRIVRETGGYLLRAASVFDLYRGDRLPAGKKSVAIALRFGGERTLKDREVDRQVGRIIAAAETSFGASLRT